MVKEGQQNNTVCSTKGQLISKCSFDVFKSPKKPTKEIPGFLPEPLKRGQIKKGVQDSQNKILISSINFSFFYLTSF